MAARHSNMRLRVPCRLMLRIAGLPALPPPAGAQGRPRRVGRMQQQGGQASESPAAVQQAPGPSCARTWSRGCPGRRCPQPTGRSGPAQPAERRRRSGRRRSEDAGKGGAASGHSAMACQGRMHGQAALLACSVAASRTGLNHKRTHLAKRIVGRAVAAAAAARCRRRGSRGRLCRWQWSSPAAV